MKQYRTLIFFFLLCFSFAAQAQTEIKSTEPSLISAEKSVATWHDDIYFSGIIDSLMLTQNWKKALYYLDSLSPKIKSLPNYAQKRGECFEFLKRYEDAITEYNKVLNASPLDPVALFRRGKSNYHANHLRNAISDMNKVIAHDSAEFMTYFVIMSSYMKLMKPDSSLYYGLLAEKQVPHFSSEYKRMHYFNLSLTELQLADTVSAISYADKAISFDSTWTPLLNLQGTLLYYTRKPAEALKWANKCIELEPQEAEHYFLRGGILFDLGRNNQACADYAKGSELGSEICEEAHKRFCKN